MTVYLYKGCLVIPNAGGRVGYTVRVNSYHAATVAVDLNKAVTDAG